jgi:hypothetical protein
VGISTNLRVLKRSRPKLQVGDVFALSPAPDRFLFGRVILTDLPRGQTPMPTANLIYVYAAEARAPMPVPLASLVPASLLLPPQFINRMPWTKGYFQNVTSQSCAGFTATKGDAFSQAAPSLAVSGDLAATA